MLCYYYMGTPYPLGYFQDFYFMWWSGVDLPIYLGWQWCRTEIRNGYRNFQD